MFVTVFTGNPITAVKLGIVFAVLIVGYIITIKLYKKVSYLVSWERKRDIAVSRNHVIDARWLRSDSKGEAGEYDWYVTYEYDLDGKTKKYRARFKNPNTPPQMLPLYYINSPRRLFSVEESHWEDVIHDVPLLIITFLPWLLAGLAFVLLKVGTGIGA